MFSLREDVITSSNDAQGRRGGNHVLHSSKQLTLTLTSSIPQKMWYKHDHHHKGSQKSSCIVHMYFFKYNCCSTNHGQLSRGRRQQLFHLSLFVTNESCDDREQKFIQTGFSVFTRSENQCKKIKKHLLTQSEKLKKKEGKQDLHLQTNWR